MPPWYVLVSHLPILSDIFLVTKAACPQGNACVPTIVNCGFVLIITLPQSVELIVAVRETLYSWSALRQLT